MSQSDEERNEERDEDCTPPEYKPLDDPVYLLLYPKLYAAAVALVELGSQFSLRSEWNSEEIFWKSSTGDHGWIELDQHRFDDCIDALLTFKAAWVRKYFPCYRSGGMYGHHLTAVNHSRGGYLEIDGDEFELLIKFHYTPVQQNQIDRPGFSTVPPSVTISLNGLTSATRTSLSSVYTA